MTELESRDFVFLEEDFPVRGKVNNDFQFYENLENDNPTIVEGLEETLNPPEGSGSDIVPNPTPMEQDHEQSQPGQKHWMAVKRILRYLKGISDYMLWYQGMKDLRLIGYSDVDWGGDVDQCKSTSGYAFLLNDSAILWSSKKQSCVALSTMEDEYVACSTTTQDAVWLRSFLQHFEIVKSALEPVTIFCDNTAALAVAKDPKYHRKTKHMKKRNHYIRDAITDKDMVLKYISTNNMVVDPLTKPIARDVFIRHVKSLGLCRM